MGCDIHGPWIEQVSWYTAGDGGACEPHDPDAIPGWWDAVAELHWQRDYELFSILADVRCSEASVFSTWCGSSDHREPKGLPWEPLKFPIDGSVAPSNPYRLGSPKFIDHVYTWNDELERGAFVSDCHSQTWLTLPELVDAQASYINETGEPNRDLALGIVIMTAATILKPDYHIRLITCFDN